MEEGTIIHVDYDLYNADSGDLIETTREDVAKEHEMHQENRSYEPMVCVVGSGNLIQGFEDSLLEAKVETDVEVDIAAVDAYGEKDMALVETMSIDKLLRHVRDPKSLYIGGLVSIEGRNGVLSYLAAGRARIDYNHPMAGRTLRYNYRIVSVIDDRGEKVKALLKSNTGLDDFEVEFEGDDIAITVPQQMLFDTNAAMLKFRMVTVLRDAVEAAKVSFIEVHETRASVEEEEHVHDENCDHDHEEE